MENKTQGENSDILDIDLIDQSEAGQRRLDLECDSCTFDFTQKSWSADMALIVEGTKLYVAKNILALASPVFFRMFQSRFEESTKNEVELPGKSMNDVIEFLRCIYPNSLSQVSCETALKILPLVEEYQVMHVKARCEKAMLESVDELSSPPAETLCQLLKEACLYNLKDLRDRCVKLASKKSQEELEIAYRLYPLPADAQNEILVKVNANLRARVKELKKSNVEMKEEVKTLKEFLTGDLKQSGGNPALDVYNWQEKSLFFILEIDKMQVSANKTVKIWDSSISITAKTKSNPEYSCVRRKNVNIPWLHLEVAFHREKPAGFTSYIRCTLVNRKTSRENLSFRFKKDMIGAYQSVKFDLKKISDISKDFVRDGKVGLIVQVYLSEPK